MTSRASIHAASPQPARPCPPPADSSQHDEHHDHDHDRHPAHDHDIGLDAHIARLVAQAPQLTSEQRDTLTLLLRRPSRLVTQPGGQGSHSLPRTRGKAGSRGARDAG